MDYSSMTYEVILQRMLNRIPDNMDKREGSIIYDALAPAAAELAILYIEFRIIENESYADTASRDYLIKRAAERGITPHPATNAIVKGIFTPSNVNIPIGTRFNSDNLNYIVISKIQGGQYQLQCETEGTVGNGFSTTLIPIDYVDGLETAQISEVLIPGEDEEDTEMLRSRYFESFDTKAFGGNKTDYVQKTNEIDGVGSTKVTPVWNGGGTVKLTIDAGCMTGDKYRLKGKGVEHIHSSRKGDMYVIIKVITPKKLSKEQKKLFEQLQKTGLEDSSEFKKIREYL